MKRASVAYRPGFHVLIGDSHSQAASMVIAPGGKEGGPDNSHDADQWLYVESGSGEAVIAGHSYPLGPGALILIQRGDRHEIRNTGTAPLKTLNVYVPPAYSSSGEEL